MITTVYPVPGRLILMPEQGFKPVPPEGVQVYLDAFYTLALNHGDITETAPEVVEAVVAPVVEAEVEVPAAQPAPPKRTTSNAK